MPVVDANVFLDATLGGNREPVARAVFERTTQTVAPPLWLSEVRNALATMRRVGRLEFSEALLILEEIRGLVVDPGLLPTDRQVLEVAAEGRCSGYDAEYVALAVLLGVPLVTFDRKLVAAFPSVAITPEQFLAA